jgi:hypothetical protein
MKNELIENAPDIGSGRDRVPASYRPSMKNSLLQSDLQDGCVIYDRDKGSVLALNITSSFYLTYCTGDYTLEQIAVESSLVTGLKTEEALKDIISTIMLFQENGLLEAD